MKPKSLNELTEFLQVGDNIRVTYPCVRGARATEIRVVSEIHQKHIITERENGERIWCDLKSAESFKFDKNGFEFFCPRTGNFCARFDYI